MSISEALLVRRLQDREESAFEEVIRLYQHKVYNLVFRMIGNREEAEDVAQEVFITVFKSAGSFRGESKFSTWLYRVAANHCKNRLKYLGRRSYRDTGALDEAAEREMQTAQAGPTTPQVESPEKALEGRQMEQLVQEGIRQL